MSSVKYYLLSKYSAIRKECSAASGVNS